MRLLAMLFPGVLAMTAACAIAGEPPAAGGFVERELAAGGTVYRYQVYVPAPGTVEGRPPVILFLHGSGERGRDNRLQLEVGLGPVVRARGGGFPAIVVFPQAPGGSEWNQLADVVFAQLDAVVSEFGGDPGRIYLTGLSMGGYGTWDLVLRAPDRFAALVPVCGGLVHPGRPSMSVRGLEGEADPYAAVARRLRHVPVWIFHGARDELVPAEYSRRLHAAFEAAGATGAHYTEFPDAGHNSWDPAYALPELWNWLFAQRRR